jgi:signal transduction histidine kinase
MIGLIVLTLCGGIVGGVTGWFFGQRRRPVTSSVHWADAMPWGVVARSGSGKWQGNAWGKSHLADEASRAWLTEILHRASVFDEPQFQVGPSGPMLIAGFGQGETAYLMVIPVPPIPVSHGVPADQLESLQLMARGLAHELNNPLTAMKLILQMPELQNQLKPEHYHVLRFELERLDKIIGDFTDFADSRTLAQAPVALADVLDEVITIVKSLYPDMSVSISKTYFSAPKVTADRHKLVQVFLNVLVNAIEAVPDYGGSIEITLKRHDPFAEIQISDSGSGIAPEHQDQIFLPFFTTKSDRVGLGLAITQKIVHAHHGQIAFVSDPGKNTVFKVRLPIEKAREESK